MSRRLFRQVSSQSRSVLTRGARAASLPCAPSLRPAHHCSRLVHFRLTMHWLSPSHCHRLIHVHTAGHSPCREPGTPGRFSPPLRDLERSCEAAADSLRGASMAGLSSVDQSRSPLFTSGALLRGGRGVPRDVFLSVLKDRCVCSAPQVPEPGPGSRWGLRLLVLWSPGWTPGSTRALPIQSCSPDPEPCSPGEAQPCSLGHKSVLWLSHWSHPPPPPREYTASARQTCQPASMAACFTEPLGLTVSLLGLLDTGAIPRDSMSCTEALRVLPSSRPLDGRRSGITA